MRKDRYYYLHVMFSIMFTLAHKLLKSLDQCYIFDIVIIISHILIFREVATLKKYSPSPTSWEKINKIEGL